MGLGSLAFEDAGEFIAMLRENVAQQKERIVEAENYERTYPSRGVAAAAIARAGLGVVWRHGCEILPVHAAQKRLAFAKILSSRLANMSMSMDMDIAQSVGEFVRFRCLMNYLCTRVRV